MKKHIVRDSLEVLKFSVSNAWQLRKSYIIIRLTIALSEAFVFFINLYLIRGIVENIIGNGDMKLLISFCCIMFISQLSLNLLKSLCLWMGSTGYITLCDEFCIKSLKKKMVLKYSEIDNPDSLNKMSFLWRTDGIVSNSIEQLCEFLSGLIIFVGSLSILGTLDWKIILFFIFITVTDSMMTRKYVEKNNKLEEKRSNKNRKLQYYRNISLDKSYGLEIRIFQSKSYFINKIHNNYQKILKIDYEKVNNNSKLQYLLDFSHMIQNIVLYGITVLRLVTKEIGVSNFFVYLAAVDRVSGSFEKMLTSIQKIAAQRTQLLRLNEYWKLEEERIKTEEAIVSVNDEIVFDHVYFKYPHTDKWVLEDINISINCNEKVSLIGENGSGKTTLIKLLCRFYEPTKGKIYLNGVDISQIDFESYIIRISSVFQDFSLLPFSLYENLCFNKMVAQETIERQLKKANCFDLISNLENGLKTHIGKGLGFEGVEFSGGERQKIAIARMYLKDTSKLFVLDEPTSAIDPIAENEIFTNIQDANSDVGIIFISHRLSNAQRCDKIIYLHEHKVMGYGPHKLLIKNCEGYKELFSMQAKLYY